MSRYKEIPNTGRHAKASTQASVATGERRSRMIHTDIPITHSDSPRASHVAMVVGTLDANWKVGDSAGSYNMTWDNIMAGTATISSRLILYSRPSYESRRLATRDVTRETDD